MGKATVKWFDFKKGFGFIVNEEGQDVFVHYTNINSDGFRCLREGQIVEYEEFESDKGLQGRGVRIIETKASPSAKERHAKAKQDSR
jgi:CspA family cold shock protein